LSAEYPDEVFACEGPPVQVDYVWGTAMLCRRDFLTEIGGLDERFFMYSEDEDLGRQATACGRTTVLVPSAGADHVGGASSSGHAPLAEARKAWATAQLLQKWHGHRAASAYSRLWRLAFALQWVVWTAKGKAAEGAAAREALRHFDRQRRTQRDRSRTGQSR
jgi:GT2 family glycosyltransferase